MSATGHDEGTQRTAIATWIETRYRPIESKTGVSETTLSMNKNREEGQKRQRAENEQVAVHREWFGLVN
jgi:hypothetical protein